jgi:hypothetical protein
MSPLRISFIRLRTLSPRIVGLGMVGREYAPFFLTFYFCSANFSLLPPTTIPLVLPFLALPLIAAKSVHFLSPISCFRFSPHIHLIHRDILRCRMPRASTSRVTHCTISVSRDPMPCGHRPRAPSCPVLFPLSFSSSRTSVI